MTDAYLDAGMRGWIVKTADQNLWRVGEWYEREDLIQDGMMCYYRCVDRYRSLSRLKRPTKENRSHFMALVKTTFANHIATLAMKQTGVPERPVSQLTDETGEEISWDALIKPEQPSASINVLVQNAPKEIVEFVTALVNDNEPYLRFQHRRFGDRVRRTRRALRETTNEKVCRQLGRPLTDVVGRINEYFVWD